MWDRLKLVTIIFRILLSQFIGIRYSRNYEPLIRSFVFRYRNSVAETNKKQVIDDGKFDSLTFVAIFCGNYPNICYSIILLLPAILYGVNSSIAAIFLPQLNLTVNEASWFVSIATYTSPIGTALGGIIIDLYGRKTVIVCSILPNFVGWSLMYWNYNTFVLLLGQIFIGLSIGFDVVPIQVYAGECIFTRNIRLRNIFMVLIGFHISFGTSVAHFLSVFMNYYAICEVMLALAAVLLVTFILVIPESPAWLRVKGRIGDAEWSEKKLGTAQPILNDKDVYKNTESETVATENKFHLWSSIKRYIQLVKRPDVYKPLLILSVGATLIPASGLITVATYMTNIIADIAPGMETDFLTAKNGTSANSQMIADAYQYGLICSLFAIAGCLVSSVVLPFIGMKKVVMISISFSILALSMLTYCSKMKSTAHLMELKISAISLITFAYGLQAGPLFAAPGDIFPLDAKGFSSITIVVTNLSTAFVNQLFPHLYQILDGYVYCFYIVISMLSLFYTQFFMPEVVGKSLDEINKEFL